MDNAKWLRLIASNLDDGRKPDKDSGYIKAAEELESLRAELATLKEQNRVLTLRLDFLLRKLPGDALRYVFGEFSDTSDMSEFIEAIDAAISAQEPK